MRTKRSAVWLSSAALLCALIWCGCGKQALETTVAPMPSAPASMASGTEEAKAMGNMEQSAGEPSNAPATPDSGGREIQLASFQQAQPDRFLIKNASITLEVKDAKDAAARLTAAMQATRGYLSEMQESVDALGVRSITMQVRVPAKGFDRAMRDIETLGKVMDRQVGAEDVTEEFVDSQSRLRNLKRTEERLLTHLGRTGKLSDTLLVERELTRVRQEIEQLEGRIRYLANRIAYSTISVTLREAAKATSPIPPVSYSSGQVASEATRSLVGFTQSLWSLIIWLAVWSPIWLPLTLATWFLVRRYQPAKRLDTVGRKSAAESKV